MSDVALIPAEDVEAIGLAAARRSARPRKVRTAPTPDRAKRSWLGRRRTGAGSRINADNIWVYRLVVLIVMGGIASAMIMSWDSLLAWGPKFALAAGLAWTIPVMLDAPIAALALGSLALRSRGRDGTANAFFALSLVFVALSGAANFLHVADTTGLTGYQDWVGAIGKGISPAVTLVLTEVLGALVTRPAGEKGKLSKLKAELKATKTALTKLRNQTTREAGQ